MVARFLLAAGALAALFATACEAPPEPPPPPGPDEVAGWKMVDLSHEYGENTLYWPTDTKGFQLDTLAEGMTPAGFFYAMKEFATAEHGGTHLDAPYHFYEGADLVGEIPLTRLIAPGVVVDVSAQAEANPDYRASAGDIRNWETEHGEIPPGTAVLFRTGWAARWPDALSYLGDDEPGSADNLHFPGLTEDAMRLLVEREAGLVGIDTASVDYGPSTDFIVHQVGGAAGIPNLENVGDLSELPPTGFLLIALPMKIEAGTGAPVRIVALIPPA
ncbi:MAG: cyclase family protein [Acidobacteria bacterium]|nr:cyclase family protein [Acidobacteriota bacterium]